MTIRYVYCVASRTIFLFSSMGNSTVVTLNMSEIWEIERHRTRHNLPKCYTYMISTGIPYPSVEDLADMMTVMHR